MLLVLGCRLILMTIKFSHFLVFSFNLESACCYYFHVLHLPTLTFQDGNAILWDLNEGKHLHTLDGAGIINALCFSPNRYWLCAATGPSIKIWVSYELNYGFTQYPTFNLAIG